MYMYTLTHLHTYIISIVYNKEKHSEVINFPNKFELTYRRQQCHRELTIHFIIIYSLHTIMLLRLSVFLLKLYSVFNTLYHTISAYIYLRQSRSAEFHHYYNNVHSLLEENATENVDKLISVIFL
jgi:hypothetical protein